MFLSFQLVSADDPWRGRHQAGGILGQGGSEVESAVGSKLALTRAPTLCWRGHSYLDGVEMATPHDVAGARRVTPTYGQRVGGDGLKRRGSGDGAEG